MADWWNFLAGRGALNKAAGTTPAATGMPAQPAGIDVGALAQQQANGQVGKAVPQMGPRGEDYDLPASRAAGEKPDSRGHLSDRFKFPIHPTFSDESIYSGPPGQHPVGGKWIESPSAEFFEPSPANRRYQTQEQLQQYMNRVEPQTTLLNPPGIPTPPKALLGGAIKR